MVMVAELMGADVLVLSGAGDRWALASDDAEVSRICLDWAVTLTVASGNAQIDVRIEQPIRFTDATGAEHNLVPEGDPVQIAPLLQIGRQSVAKLTAFADG